MFRNGLQAWHVIVLLVVIVLLFGANRLPGVAKSVGQSMKIFRDEMKDFKDDKKDDTTPGSSGTPGDGTPGDGQSPKA
jgi:sec-independent protein translocase protein TatA